MTDSDSSPERADQLTIRRARNPIREFFRILGWAAYRFYWDDCFSRAAALAYTTLFALVPVTALSLSMFRIFGMQGEEAPAALRTVLEQILPPMANSQLMDLQSQLLYHLQQFAVNVSALNTVSIAVLVFTSIALLNTIESALNVVWRATSNLSIVSKIANFWAVITLGPLLIAVSIYWTTKVRAFGLGEELSSIYYFAVSYVFPTVVTMMALTLLFYKLPAARVALKDALLGGFVAAILFEFIKRGFAHYVGLSTTYSTIYGVVASIPLFLFWLYVAWVVVLFGAEISYQSGAIHILSGLRRYVTQLGEVGAILGLRILLCVGRNFLQGKTPPTEGEVAIETGSDPTLVQSCLNVLSEAGLISPVDERTHIRSLVVSPDKITIGDVLQTFMSKNNERHLDSPAQNGETVSFLNLIKRAGERDRSLGAESSYRGRDITEWTLSDLLALERE